MERFSDTPHAMTPLTWPVDHDDGHPSPATRPHRHCSADMRAVVAAHFAMYQMAQEAIDEGRLWFAEEDFVCLHDFAALPAGVHGERSVCLMTRVRDQIEASRAMEIMRGRGATRVAMLPLPGDQDRL